MQQLTLFTSVHHWTVNYIVCENNPRFKAYPWYETFYYESQAWGRFRELSEQAYQQRHRTRLRKIKDVRLKTVLEEFVY